MNYLGELRGLINMGKILYDNMDYMLGHKYVRINKKTVSTSLQEGLDALRKAHSYIPGRGAFKLQKDKDMIESFRESMFL